MTDRSLLPELLPDPLEAAAGQALRAVPLAADPGRVRRTQRVVRERALRSRSFKGRLAVVMLGCAMVSLLLGVAAFPLWSVLDDMAHSWGIPDLQVHMLFLAVWFLPGTIAALLLWRGQRKRIEQITRWQQLAQR
jgi:hypothetical protein